MSDHITRPWSRLRTLTNVLVVALALLGLDAATAWWRGQQTISCASAALFSSESAITAIGIGGVILAMVGVMLGGVRHALAGIGLVILVTGLILGSLLPELTAPLCGPP